MAMHQRQVARVASVLVVALLASCASVIPGSDAPKPRSVALPPDAKSPLAATFAVPATAAASESGYRMLSAGKDGLLARLELIDGAQQSLDLQYYIFRADRSGTAIAGALLRAADRGVRVRVLIDDGESVPGDERILALAAHPHIELRMFNPWRIREPHRIFRNIEFVLHKRRLDYRMHNKLFVADNVVALIGGRNVGDQYFQIDPQSQFGDDDLVVAGPMVQRLASVYDEFWNSDLAIPVRAIDRKDTSDAALARLRALSGADPASEGTGPGRASRPVGDGPIAAIRAGRTPLVWSSARLIYDSPDKKDVTRKAVRGHLIYDAVAAEARSVSTELVMITPYFVPSNDELQLLAEEREHHARVRALTNSLDAAPELAAHSGYMHYRRRLLELGVDLHEIRADLGNSRGSGQPAAISRYGNYALHGKLFVFDRKSTFVGSLNFDQRSKRINTEIGLIVHSPDISAQVGQRFDELTTLDNSYQLKLEGSAGDAPHLAWETRKNGQVIEFRHEPSRSLWRKLKVEVLTLLPLDPEL
jgi:putative cardiolipin synthase